MNKIIYGPQGCGKTTNAEALARHFGLCRIIDNGVDEIGNAWTPGDSIPDGTLVLTNSPGIVGAVNFDEAMAAMRSTSA